MTLAEDFADLAIQTVSVQAPGTTRNARGELTAPGATVRYQARVVAEPSAVRTDTGEVVTSSTVAWIFGATGLTVDHTYTLPDGSTPAALRVESYPDETGDHFEKVYFS